MRPEFEQAEPNSVLPKVLLAVGLIAAAGLAYFLWSASQTDSTTQQKVVTAPAPAPVVASEPPPVTPEPQPEEPAAEPPVRPPEPLPALENSDAFITDKLAEAPAGDSLLKLLVPDNLLLKSVRAVMVLDEGAVVHDYRPVQSPPAALKVKKINEPLDIDIGQRYTLSPENYTRYQPWVTAITRSDKKAMASLYQRVYPLLEEAYLQHGVDRGNFHNVLLAVIDNVLAAPVLDDEIVLIQPKVFYQFQDPALEKAPAVHRLLWRMGPDNTRAIQTALREFKQELLALNMQREQK